MSTPQETEQVVTEGHFVQAFLRVLHGAFNLALKRTDWQLYVATSGRNDSTMFDLLEDMDLRFTQDFARKATEHQAAMSKGEPVDELFVVASAAAEASTELANICEDIAVVKHYCAELGVETNSFTTQELMRLAAVQASE